MSSTISEIEDMHQKMILGRKSKKAVEYLNGSNFRFVKLHADTKRGLLDVLPVNGNRRSEGQFLCFVRISEFLEHPCIMGPVFTHPDKQF